MLEALLASPEPSLRWKVLTGALGYANDDATLAPLRREIAGSPRVRALLSQRSADGTIPHPPYRKWIGVHWVLVDLADLGYPPSDEALRPLVNQLLAAWTGPNAPRVRIIADRPRRCASQEGNAMISALLLGYGDDPRLQELVQRLLACQWPDGGWNCDKRPEATHSSYHETLIPTRALALWARRTGDAQAAAAADAAAEVMLKRRLYRRLADGAVIHPSFVALCYPYTWHYNVVYALRVMAEMGRIHDPRCADALDLLQAKRLDDGGWPAEQRWYRHTASGTPYRSGGSLVDWGGVSRRRTNPWVTAEVLGVLAAAQRLPDDILHAPEAEVTIRPMRPGEASAVSALVHDGFMREVAPTCEPEGVQRFLDDTAPEAVAEMPAQGTRVLVAEQGGALVGVIARRGLGHIRLWFVRRDWQQRGIGRALLGRLASESLAVDPSLPRITANASRNALGIYAACGFCPTAPEQCAHGIRFTPVERSLST